MGSTNGHSPSPFIVSRNRSNDSEAAGSPTSGDHGNRNRNRKRCAYIAAFVVFQTGVILLFTLVFMRVRAPKLRLDSVTVTDVSASAGGSGVSPSFNISLTADFAVKNNNFGPYEYPNTTVSFFYRGRTVGSVDLRSRKVAIRSGKATAFTVSLSSVSPDVGDDVSSGKVTVNAVAELKGKVGLMIVMKKKRSAKMNCSLSVDLASKAIRGISC